jgi:NADH-quinone oxidoreductase subunit D
MSKIDHYTLHFNAQNLSANGMFHLVLDLKDEVVQHAEPHLGLSHRGVEKLSEHHGYHQNIPYMDRLDYTAMMCNEHAYVLTIEKLLQMTPPLRAQYIRVLFSEMTRILSHLMWLGSHSLDLGVMNVLIYCLRDRESLIDAYEAVSGARMHANYFRPGGVYRDLPKKMPLYSPSSSKNKDELKDFNLNRQGSLLDFLEDFTKKFTHSIDEYETLLTENRIWKRRLIGIGVVSPERAFQMGFSGPMLRASGIAWDLRKKQPYEIYKHLEFDVPIGRNGDSYDRYLVRIEEMRQSNDLMQQCIVWLKKHDGLIMQPASQNASITPPTYFNKPYSFHKPSNNNDAYFNYFTQGYTIPLGEAYAAVEHPKGEFGVYILSNGTHKPYRLKIRSPGFSHLAGINEMLKGHTLSDVIALMGSMDLVLSEIER